MAVVILAGFLLRRYQSRRGNVNMVTTEWKAGCSQTWIDVCNFLERQGDAGAFVPRRILKRIVINAPAVLIYVLICTLIQMLSTLFTELPEILAVHDQFTDFWNPLSYASVFTHVLAHSDWNHLKGNMVHLLLVGPSVEHAFGSRNLLVIIILVAFSSALVHLAIGKLYTYQLGASGVVLSLILLSSLVTTYDGSIPLSFLLVATWWIGDEMFKFFLAEDSISHHAHISGGLVGTLAGYYIHRQQLQAKSQGTTAPWYSILREKKTR